MVGNFEDVGLRATIQNIGAFDRDAKKVNAEMAAIGRSASAAAVQSKSAFSGIVSALKPLGLALAGAFAVSKITSGIGGTIRAASDLSESMNKVDVVFGESAQAVKEFADTASQALGQSKQEALEAASSFGNLFKTIGLAPREMSKMSTELVTLASDLASFNNQDPQDMLRKLRSGLIGEVEPLRSVGILLNEATVQQRAFDLGLATSKNNLSEAAKVQARYSLILEQSGAAQGDFARTSDGLANSQRILRASFVDIQATIGNRLLPVVAPLVHSFARSLPGAMAGLERVLDTVGGAMGEVGRVMGIVVQEAKPLLDFVGGVGGAFLDFAREAGPSVLAIFRQLAVIGVQSSSAFQLVSRAFSGMSSVSLDTRAALDGLRAILKGVSDALKAVADPAGVVMSTMREVGAVITAAFQTVIDIALPIMEEVWSGLVSGWESIAPLIQPALDGIAKVVQGVLAGIQQFWQDWGGNILAIARSIFDVVGTIIKRSLDNVMAVVRVVLRLIAGDWEGAWAEIQNLVRGVFLGILDIVKSLGGLLFELMKTLVKSLKLESQWYDVRDFVLKLWSDIVNGVKLQLNQLIGNVNGFLDSISAISRTLNLSIIGLPPIEFRVKPFNVEDFIPPPRPGWFGDEANLDLDLFNKNLDKARKGSSFLSDFLARFKAPQWSKLSPDVVADQESVKDMNDELVKIGTAATAGADGAKAALKGLDSAVKETEGVVKGLEASLKEAQDAMRGFADPRLTGMQQAEDELFELDQAIKRARLEELQLGDAGKEAAKDVVESAKDMSGGFDLLSAQQQELASGIPVPFQKAMDEIEKARREATQAAQEAAAPAAATETGVEESEVDRLRRLREIKQLQMELDFEPQQRALRETFEELTGANAEITFDQALEGLIASKAEADAIIVALDTQEAILEAQKTILDAQKEAIDGQKEATAAVADVRTNTLAVEQEVLSTYQQQSSELEKQKAIMRTQAEAIVSAAKVGVDPNQFSVGAAFAGGGTVGRGGVARVGERGPETVILPSGAQVVPSGPGPSSSTSISESSTFNIEGVRDSIDVADQVRRIMAFQRIRRGRG